MEVIQLKHPYQGPEMPSLVVALGYFDGVHLGHQKVVSVAKQKALELGCKSAVMTFDPHPSVVLGKGTRHTDYISPLKDKIKLFGHLEIDYLFVVTFSLEFANLLPQEFIDQYIIALNVKHVVAGFDFTYGRLGKGTMETLPFHSRNQFGQTIVDKQAINEDKISSTLIRHLINQGDMDKIPSYLGRYYQTEGTVIHGDKRGRTIGFPTANIRLSGNYLLPPVGVYAVKIMVHNVWYQGICNIGFKPTFNEKMDIQPSIEIHIFDFNHVIYGETVMIEWKKFIRTEKKFNGISELVNQINIDIKVAIEYFNFETD